jgi:S1-C subfamily serine protease
MRSFLVDFSNELANAVERAGAAVIAVEEGGREGVSGTLWRDGVAVTAEHTIRGRDEVTVKLPLGERTTAEVVGRDSGTDLALLRVSGAVGHVAIANEASLRVGEIVLSIGRRKAEGLAATYGVISAIGGPWRTWQGSRIDRWLRLDLNPFPGFSGGPVVNAHGEAVGMATSGPRRSAVTIPASTVSRVVDQLLLKGRVSRGYLGVRVQPVAFPEGAAKGAGVSAEHGLLVVMVEPEGPAANAGVLLGDILLSIAGAELIGAQSMQPALDGENIGKSVKVDVVRGGQLLHIDVVVGERPER